MANFSLTVVVPVYRIPDWQFKAALDSLINQTLTDFIVFFVFSENSDFSNVQIIKEFYTGPYKILTAKESGLGNALFFAFSQIDSKYVARFDADDVSLPARFQLQIDFLENNSDYSVCGSQISVINHNSEVIGRRNYPCSNKKIRNAFNWSSPLAHPAITFRSCVFKKFNYCPGLNFAEDLDLFLRLRNNGCKFYNLPYTLLLYREVEKFRTLKHRLLNLFVRVRNFHYFNDLFAIALSLSVLFLNLATSQSFDM